MKKSHRGLVPVMSNKLVRIMCDAPHLRRDALTIQVMHMT